MTAQIHHMSDARAKEIVGSEASNHRGRTSRKQPLLNITSGVLRAPFHPKGKSSCELREVFGYHASPSDTDTDTDTDTDNECHKNY